VSAGTVFVLNAGSSSLKYQLVDPDSGAVHASGTIERIGEPDGVPDHQAAVREALDDLEGLPEPIAVGHRVVHGGDRFVTPTLVTDEVVAAVEELAPLAPLHNPPNLTGLRLLRRRLPDLPHVAVFDTAFHATLPPHAYTYALPRELARTEGIRRYGFHGTSYAYVSRRAATLLGIPYDEVNLVVCHLGNGASVAAIAGGRSVDTSMGMTPLEGLVMGTRSGDVDPGVLLHLMRHAGYDADTLDTVLNRRSGLTGLSGHRDMRAVHAAADAGDADAQLALTVAAYRIRKYVGAYLAVVPDVHALVFTGGIGENDAALRAAVCEPLAHLGISADGTGAIRVLVVPTNEEAEIAAQAAAVVRGTG
jgi:acetate kinase